MSRVKIRRISKNPALSTDAGFFLFYQRFQCRLYARFPVKIKCFQLAKQARFANENY